MGSEKEIILKRTINHHLRRRHHLNNQVIINIRCRFWVSQPAHVYTRGQPMTTNCTRCVACQYTSNSVSVPNTARAFVEFPETMSLTDTEH